MTSYNSATGNKSGHVYLYSYVFCTSTGHAIASIQLPNDSKIKILAIDEVLAPAQAVLAIASVGGNAAATRSQPLSGAVLESFAGFARHDAGCFGPTVIGADVVSAALDKMHSARPRHHSKKQPRHEAHSAPNKSTKKLPVAQRRKKESDRRRPG